MVNGLVIISQISGKNTKTKERSKMKQLLAALLITFAASAASAKSHDYWMENVTLNDLIIQNNGMPGYWNWLMDNGGWATMSNYQEEKAEFIFDFMQMDMPDEPIEPIEYDHDYTELFDIIGIPTHFVEIEDDVEVWKKKGGIWVETSHSGSGHAFFWSDPMHSHYSYFAKICTEGHPCENPNTQFSKQPLGSYYHNLYRLQEPDGTIIGTIGNLWEPFDQEDLD